MTEADSSSHPSPQLSHCSVDYMTVYRDAAVHTREAASQSVGEARRFIDQCAQLDERMLAVSDISSQLGNIESALTALEDKFDAAARPSTQR